MNAAPIEEELVVLVSETGDAIGTELKARVHHADTPLHLAFSCYVFDRQGRTLVTRRARSKLTWPAVRTNSCCGHPGAGESTGHAVVRRLRQELGLQVDTAELILPTFRYRAQMADGIVENEICPVYRVIIDGPQLDLNSDEVDEAWWVPWAEYLAAADDDDDPLSPWSAVQVSELRALGPDPLVWPVRGDAQLPPAARADLATILVAASGDGFSALSE